tara:strand:+ start:180 stop:527 length:348 start_codon:yes stop_codon:yes gene_type:complete
MAVNVDRVDFLMVSTKGEKYAKDTMTMLTHTNCMTGIVEWEKATIDYSFDPFGKLVKKPARVLPNGKVFEYKKHYHGWFGMLICTRKFYEVHKDVLDEFITHDDFFSRKWLPNTY